MSFRVRVSVRFGIGNLIVDPCGRKTPVILECKCDNVDFNLCYYYRGITMELSDMGEHVFAAQRILKQRIRKVLFIYPFHQLHQ